MPSIFIEKWNNYRKKAIYVALISLVASLPIAWIIIKTHEVGLTRIIYLVLLGGLVGLTAITMRYKLSKISKCPSCRENLIEFLMAAVKKKKEIKYCPICGENV